MTTILSFGRDIPGPYDSRLSSISLLEIIQGDFMRTVEGFKDSRFSNHSTFILLGLKVDDARDVSDFCPNSLFGTAYKIITKKFPFEVEKGIVSRVRGLCASKANIGLSSPSQ